MKLTNDDWDRLKRLRDRFLGDAFDNYWATERDLELYNTIYAERIGWKWNDVLATLTHSSWKPQSDKIIDWGCGTGIASRKVAPWSLISEVALHDQSSLALAFAKKELATSGITATTFSEEEIFPKKTLLLLSHVLGELHEEELVQLARRAATAEEVIWVEPGSRIISKKLSAVRAIFHEAGHQLIAPCVHENPCPMLTPEHDRDWCHFFAEPPPEIFQSAFWQETSRKLGIDLRSLPYSYLVFSRHHAPSLPSTSERLIGRPRELKAHGKLFCCGASGLCERILQKRDNPTLFKKLIKHQEPGAFTWFLDETGKILEAREQGKILS